MQDFREDFKRKMWDAVNFVPYPKQDRAFSSRKPINQIVGGVRAGKSRAGGMKLAAECWVPNGLYWLVGPDYEQARPEFLYCEQALAANGFLAGKPSKPQRGGWTMQTIWGATIATKSSRDILALASFAVNGAVMCEAAQHIWDVYFKLLERCLEERAWMWLTGTFETSMGWYADYFEKNKSGINPYVDVHSWATWDNTIIFPGGENDPALLLMKEDMPPDLFLERCGAKPVKPRGLVHQHYDPMVHVKNLQFDEQYPVELAIDPGYGGAYAVLFVQALERDVHVLDEVYARGEIARDVIARVKSRPLFPYVTGGVIDVAGTQHHATLSQVEIWGKYAPSVPLRWQKIGVADGINVIDLYLKSAGSGKPRLYFDMSLDQTREMNGLAKGILSEFLLRKNPEFKEGQAESDKPIKANDHALNALGYYLYDLHGPVAVKPPPHPTLNRGTWR